MSKLLYDHLNQSHTFNSSILRFLSTYNRLRSGRAFKEQQIFNLRNIKLFMREGDSYINFQP